jgi:ribosome-associated heat shock protein Hsp15
MTTVEDRTVRLDKWLWAARFYKTRSLAAKACDGGKVDVNGQAAKPHKLVRSGDRIKLSLSSWRREVRVLLLSDRRGPASEARLLYEDLTPPPPLAARRTAPPVSRPPGAGRPTKRERRLLDRIRGA